MKIIQSFMNLFITLLLLTGCVSMSGQMAVEQNLRVNKYVELRNQHRYDEALETIRDEIKSPIVKTNAYKTDIRVLGIQALGYYANAHGLKPGFDEEMQRYYEEGRKFSEQDPRRLAMLEHMVVLYYSQTNRNRKALGQMYAELEMWKKIGDDYQVIIAYDALASMYSDMGELELRDLHRNIALKKAEKYFQWEKSLPTDSNEWLNYSNIIEKTMDNLAVPGNAEVIAALWNTVKKINGKYIAPHSRYVDYNAAAVYFSIAGDKEIALELLKEARSLTASVTGDKRKQRAEYDYDAQAAHVYLNIGDIVKAREYSSRAIELGNSLNLSADAVLYRVYGEANELSGDLEAAIKAYETSIEVYEEIRTSIPVAERATFFRGVGRKAHWGLIRTYAKKFSLSRKDADLISILNAAEQIRARQFGELIAEGTATEQQVAINELRKNLTSDSALLSYIQTNRGLVFTVITKDSGNAGIIDVDLRTFTRRLARLTRSLAEPWETPRDSLDKELIAISKLLLSPLHSKVRNKAKLIIIPDGAINAIPFDVLSWNTDEYRPMVEDTIVLSAPSLKFFMQAETQRSAVDKDLFALGDPLYASNPTPGNLPQDVLENASRGSNYLQYFAPLPETRTEVEKISRLFDRSKSLLIFGTQATESRIKRASLEEYRYLHFATHGILGGEIPGIGEPALVMAQEPDQDGLFTASEAQSMRFNSDLAVLSACNTGTGMYYTGEGVMGMSRAFLLAGSRAVLVSLWSVDSLATEKLAVRFYQYLRAGKSSPAALRQAKLDLIHAKPGSDSDLGTRARGLVIKTPKAKTKFLHPFYWSAFILIGSHSEYF
jgi:CHAT domain-containing protein